LATTKAKLSKGHIALALALGGIGAAGAAVMVDALQDDDRRYVQDDRRDARDGGRDNASQTYPFAGFDRISVAGPYDVEITRGDRFSVSAEGSEGAIGEIEVLVEDGELVIRPRDDISFGDWGDGEDVTFQITMPQAEQIDLAGPGDITLDRVDGPLFEASVTGPGSLTIGQMDVDRADFSVAGSGEIAVDGTAREVEVAIGGSGEISAGGLRATNASIVIGGSGDVELYVEDDADVTITGSGDVEINGPAVCSVTTIGSGDVSCEGGGGNSR